jgi:hypothetical protein
MVLRTRLAPTRGVYIATRARGRPRHRGRLRLVLPPMPIPALLAALFIAHPRAPQDRLYDRALGLFTRRESVARPVELDCDPFLGCAPGTLFAAAWRGRSIDGREALRSPFLGVSAAAAVPLVVGLPGDSSLQPLVFAHGFGLAVATTF